MASEMAKLVDEAVALFGVKADRIPSVLWVLALREACTRCGGSGHYSRCQQYGTICFKCAGRRETAAKLTKRVMEAARAKVAARELEAARERGRALKAAKARIASLDERARAVYDAIADAYDAIADAYEAAYRAKWDCGDAEALEIPAALAHAQSMNNAIFFGYAASGRPVRLETSVTDIRRAVESGARCDYEACVRELEEAIGMLETLRDTWLASHG